MLALCNATLSTDSGRIEVYSICCQESMAHSPADSHLPHISRLVSAGGGPHQAHPSPASNRDAPSSTGLEPVRAPIPASEFRICVIIGF